MKTLSWLLCSLLCCSAIPIPFIQSAVDYFKPWNLKFATGILCDLQEAHLLAKRFSSSKIRSNFVSLTNLATSHLIDNLESPYQEVAVLLDCQCNGSDVVLRTVAEQHFLGLTHHWLMFAGRNYPRVRLEEWAKWASPPKLNATAFLSEETDRMKQRKFVEIYNKELNEDVLKDLEIGGNEFASFPAPDVEMRELIGVRAMADSEVAIAVPGSDEFELYEIYRLSENSNVYLKPIGSLSADSVEYTLEEFNAVKRRTDFEGAIVLSALAVVHYDYLSRSGELTNEEYDHRAMIGMELSQLVETQLNFRMLIKVFDDYGWFKGNKFTGMVKWFYLRKLELSAAGLIIHKVRMPAMDYVHPNFQLKVGVLFSAPTLSQVSNIFTMPFGKDVWTSLLVIIIVSAFVLFWQMRVTSSPEDRGKYDDAFAIIASATLQQGSQMNASSLSVRLTIMVFLLSSLCLFVAYTANIVTLLQTPSDKIRSLEDLAESTLEVAVENLSYAMNLIKEDTDPAMRLLLKTKLANKTKGYISAVEGVPHIKEGLYAFHVEIHTAYKMISEIFTEREKCRLKKLSTYPFLLHSAAVPKKSPFREILAQKYTWLHETGLLKRSTRRWIAKESRCGQNVVGYSKIGIPDVLPVFLFYCYGAGASIVILVVECGARKSTRKRLQPPDQTELER